MASAVGVRVPPFAFFLCSPTHKPENEQGMAIDPSTLRIDLEEQEAWRRRLTVTVRVQGTDKELKHEIARENSLTRDQLDSWRQYISGLPAVAES